LRLLILSDLHLEFGGFTVESGPDDYDAVVLAGDIGTGTSGVAWAKQAFEKPVLYVPGNHEYYGCRVLPQTLEKMRREADGSNVTVLDRDSVDIDGVTFIGATLWTDYAVDGDQDRSMTVAAMSLNDHHQIFIDDQHRFTPADALDEHRRSLAFIQGKLEVADRDRTVVITHHAPSVRSVHERFSGSPINVCFVSRLDPLIEAIGPALWVHGHVHDPFDYRIGTTRVVANPRGYVGFEDGNGFNPKLILEV
jgi:hypothetical protein